MATNIELIPSPRKVPREHWLRDFKTISQDILNAKTEEDFQYAVRHLRYAVEEI